MQLVGGHSVRNISLKEKKEKREGRRKKREGGRGKREGRREGEEGGREGEREGGREEGLKEGVRNTFCYIYVPQEVVYHFITFLSLETSG